MKESKPTAPDTAHTEDLSVLANEKGLILMNDGENSGIGNDRDA